MAKTKEEMMEFVSNLDGEECMQLLALFLKLFRETNESYLETVKPTGLDKVVIEEVTRHADLVETFIVSQLL